MTTPAVRLNFPESDIALLTFDDPQRGANVLSQHVLEELEQHLDQLLARDDLAGLILTSGKPGIFIAGADLREFAAAENPEPQWVQQMCRRGQELFARLSQAPFVTVAAIAGVCVGGGAELATWCDRRVMADEPKTQIGFPEVKLGLFPGWGGTARLPRMVGLSNAVEMTCTGDSISAREAHKLGLAEDVVPPERLMAAAIGMVRAEADSGQYRQDRQRWSQPIEISETELAFLAATGSAYIQQQTKGHYPAPMAALETMIEAAALDLEGACRLEAERFSTLFGTPVNRALINVFFLSDRNKKDPGVDDPAIEPRKVESLGIYGAGIMGSGIAAAALKRGLSVALTDAKPEALQRGLRNTLEEASYDRKLRGPSPERLLELAPRLSGTLRDEEVTSCQLVLEAVVENPDVKTQLLSKVEELVGEETLIATNTSTIPINRLAKALKHPERFCGIHFFNPVRRMPLVEVIRGEHTSDQTVATAVAFAKRLGKSPIVLKDGPGFLVNRVLFPYMNEALQLIGQGVPIPEIEKAATRFGMPMGPIALYDMVGMDTALYAGTVMHEAFGDRYEASPILIDLVKRNRLGQKSGRGFFRYDNPKGKPEPDPELEQILARHIEGETQLSREQITQRLFLPMLLEATRILEDELVRDPRDVDLGVIYGIGFPPFRGGLLFWADTEGPERIMKWLEPLVELGPRFEPTAVLQDWARSGRRFYHILP